LVSASAEGACGEAQAVCRCAQMATPARTERHTLMPGTKCAARMAGVNHRAERRQPDFFVCQTRAWQRGVDSEAAAPREEREDATAKATGLYHAHFAMSRRRRIKSSTRAAQARRAYAPRRQHGKNAAMRLHVASVIRQRRFFASRQRWLLVRWQHANGAPMPNGGSAAQEE